MARNLKAALLGLALAGATAHAEDSGAEPASAPTSVVWAEDGKKVRNTLSSEERDPRSCEALNDVVQMVGEVIHTTEAGCRILVGTGVARAEIGLTPGVPNLESVTVTLDPDTRLPQVTVNFVEPNRRPLVIQSPKDADAIRAAIEAALQGS